MDFRKTFDKIPEDFDKYRPRYCKELFQELEMVCGLNPEKKVLEIGPGTGQATIQWIPEEIAFTKTYNMLRPGGYLAMFMTRSDETSANPSLRDEIDKVYDKYFRVKQRYNCKMDYENVLNYGFENLKYKEWKSVRKLNADEYICYISTHCEHITLTEPYKSNFYAGIRKAIVAAGNEIVIIDTIPLYLMRKPL